MFNTNSLHVSLQKALDALNKKDLAEVKSYGRPPARVELVMEAVMIFKQVEPTWSEAKRQLGDPNFLLQVPVVFNYSIYYFRTNSSNNDFFLCISTFS